MVFIKGNKPWNKGKEGLKGELNPFFGKTHSNEQKRKWSLMRKGISSWSKGKKLSKGHRAKLSASHRGKHVSPTTEFKKGMIPWNKGKTREDDSRIAQPWLNRKIPREMVVKAALARTGKYCGANSPNWKGGLTTKNKLEREKFRKYVQKTVFERDNYTCQLCGSRGVDLQVDHIQRWSEYIELRFNISNCRTLCVECHYEVTFGKPMSPIVKAWGHHLIRRNLK